MNCKTKNLNLQSLDLILCSGNGSMSNRIKKFQKMAGGYTDEESQISHIASIYKPNDCVTEWVQESTTFNKWCDKKGVQINDMTDWLDNYDGKVWTRKIDVDRNNKFLMKDSLFWLKHKNDQYENGIMGGLELFFCGLGWHKYIQKVFPKYHPLETKNPHCSELTAKRMIEHNLFNRLVYPNRMPPAMWWQQIDDLLSVKIGKPIRIK